MADVECGCIRCVNVRRNAAMERDDFSIWDWMPGPNIQGWRYACELCGNKRCPHHTDHALACTRSNEPGQEGSVYA